MASLWVSYLLNVLWPDRWMATGGSGHLMEHVQGHVVEESSWLNVNATIRLQPMKGSIVKGFELNIAPAVWIPALLQVRFNKGANCSTVKMADQFFWRG